MDAVVYRFRYLFIVSRFVYVCTVLIVNHSCLVIVLSNYDYFLYTNRLIARLKNSININPTERIWNVRS